MTADLTIGHKRFLAIAPIRGDGEYAVFALACRLRAALSNQTLQNLRTTFDPAGFYDMVLSAFDGRPVRVNLNVN